MRSTCAAKLQLENKAPVPTFCKAFVWQLIVKVSSAPKETFFSQNFWNFFLNFFFYSVAGKMLSLY